MDAPNRIREHREARDMTIEELAEATGLSVSYVSRLEKGGRNLSVRNLNLFAHALGVEAGDLLPSERPQRSNAVAVMGLIGAGAEIQPEFEQVPPEGLYEVEVPFPVPEDALAFEVQGDSMWPRYDPGDVIICWRFGNHPEEVIGWEAAVRTTDGRRFLKRVLRGAAPGTFDLESFNSSPIRGVNLDWVGKVHAVVRAGDWRRLEPGRQEKLLRKLVT